MSLIGKKPISVPSGVTVEIKSDQIVVEGPKGKLTKKLHPFIRVSCVDNMINVSVPNPQEKEEKMIWGTMASIIKNMIEGAKEGFQKQLEIIGTGFKASIQGSKINLSLGFSHPVEFILPDGISATIEKNILTIFGADKEVVGEVAARIRRIRPPDSYKGKGVRLVGELLKLKPGKQAKTTAGGAA